MIRLTTKFHVSSYSCAAIEITNERMDHNNKFRAKVHVQEVSRNAASSPKEGIQRRPDQGYVKSNESRHRSPKGSVLTVSLLQEKGGNILFAY